MQSFEEAGRGFGFTAGIEGLVLGRGKTDQGF